VKKGVSFDKKIEVEPLGEAGWGRVERALLDSPQVLRSMDSVRPRSDGPARWRLMVSLVLAGAVASVGGAVAWRSLMQVESQGGPTRVETGANGSRVEIGESLIEVGPQSAVRVNGDDTRGVVIVLEGGRIECEVAPRHGRPPLIVEAGAVEVRVVGTHFVVTRAGDDTSVDVQRGEVEVSFRGSHALVDAGSHWPPSDDASRGNHAPANASTPPATPIGGVGSQGNAARAGAMDNRAVSSSSPSAALNLSPRERYEMASALEAKQPQAALAGYRELAQKGGPWAQNALFAQGRLEADLGDRDEARRLLLTYLARYPGGPNADDARQLLDRMR
jgi:hypothetical protein